MVRGRGLHPTKTHQLAYWDKYQQQPETLPVSIDDRRATSYVTMETDEKYGEGDTPIGQQAASIIGGSRPVMIGLSIEQAAQHKQQYAHLYGNKQHPQVNVDEQQYANQYLPQSQQSFSGQEYYAQNNQNSIWYPPYNDPNVEYVYGNASISSHTLNPEAGSLGMGGPSRKIIRNTFPPMPSSTPSAGSSPGLECKKPETGHTTKKPERISRSDPPTMTKVQHSIAAAFGNIDKRGKVKSKYPWMNATYDQAAISKRYKPTPPPDDPRWTIFTIGHLSKDPLGLRRLGLTTSHLRIVIKRALPGKTGLGGLGVVALVTMIEELRGKAYSDEGFHWWLLIPYAGSGIMVSKNPKETDKMNLEEDTESSEWDSEWELESSDG